MRCHNNVLLSWFDVPDGLMYRWNDVKVGHFCLVMIDKKYQTDKLQSGPLMVKSLTQVCLRDNVMKINEFSNGTTPYG
jgi:hypothetical protein